MGLNQVWLNQSFLNRSMTWVLRNRINSQASNLTHRFEIFTVIAQGVIHLPQPTSYSFHQSFGNTVSKTVGTEKYKLFFRYLSYTQKQHLPNQRSMSTSFKLQSYWLVLPNNSLCLPKVRSKLMTIGPTTLGPVVRKWNGIHEYKNSEEFKCLTTTDRRYSKMLATVISP